jgi:hypothetical protein
MEYKMISEQESKAFAKENPVGKKAALARIKASTKMHKLNWLGGSIILFVVCGVFSAFVISEEFGSNLISGALILAGYLAGKELNH